VTRARSGIRKVEDTRGLAPVWELYNWAMAEGSLKGHVLIAAPGLIDPNFRRAVVLILEHTPDGAVGLVLNRPSELAAGEAVPDLEPLVDVGDPVYVGGPVQPQAVIALAEYTDGVLGDRSVVGPIAPLEVDGELSDMVDRVSRVRVFAGYAGWGEGQLDDELEEDAWFTAPALPGDVFGEDHATLWNRVLRRMGGRYRLIATMPDDPAMN
jgi:putative transcriptional regulator